MPDPIRVCLLVDGNTVSEWQRRALDEMMTGTNAEVSVIVRNRAQSSRSRIELLKRAIELREWTLIWAFRTLFSSPFPLTDAVDISSLEYLQESKCIDCVPETVDGWKNEISTAVVEEVAADADVAIRFGFGFLVGDILTELEHGVLSYHHGDIREYRGQPMGCWEYIHGKDTAGITLQRINKRLDAGEVLDLKTISIDDARTYREVKDRLLDDSTDMLATVISKLERGETDFETYDDLGELYTIPSGWNAVRFAMSEIHGGIQQRWL
jgi:methionyl-tRNA formyltransferase